MSLVHHFDLKFGCDQTEVSDLGHQSEGRLCYNLNASVVHLYWDQGDETNSDLTSLF